MNALTYFHRFLVILILAVSYYLSSPVQAQTIQIDSTFTSDGEIFPFGPNDTIYGLSISGYVSLTSDTSLVRVIVTDTLGNEWMVYEAYPMIVTDSAFDLEEVCDETCYLEEFYPHSLIIQIIDAEITISDLLYSKTRYQNLSELQQEEKGRKDLEKVQLMNQYIASKGWEWVADTNEFVSMYYRDKVTAYYNKYNLLGRDYYSEGSFYTIFHDCVPQYNDNSIIPSFDWMKKHNADNLKSPYWDHNPDHDEIGNGWMTGLRSQVCGSCSAFASIASLEAAINLYANYQFDVEEGSEENPVRFSERDAFVCSAFQGDVGCDCTGKFIYEILNKIRDKGVVNEECFPKDDNTPYCPGPLENCSFPYTSKCTIPDWTAQICQRKMYQFNASGNVGQTERSNWLKKLILDNGPLTVEIRSTHDPVSGHSVSLIGFQFNPNTDQIDWIYKNSSPKSYCYEPLYLGNDGGEGCPYIENSMYAFVYDEPCPNPTQDPIMVSSNNPEFEYKVHEKDFDKDGYYNWGIGQKPSTYSCSQEEDSNDDDNKIGPFEEDYSGRPVKPIINVQRGEGAFGLEINDGDVINLVEENHSEDIDYAFEIKNTGNAQLNLEQYQLTGRGKVTIEAQDITESFEIKDSNLPATSVCWSVDNNYTSFYITLKACVQPGAVAHIHIYFETDQDLDPVFEFTLVYNGCETDEGTFPVENELIWDGIRTQLIDVHITSTGKLRVTGTVHLSSDADIVVERGGKLIIDGGRLTSSCNNLWNGVQVWGYSDKSQFDPVYIPGQVEVLNNGIIENAKIAIAAVKSENGINDERYTGGVIICEDSKFLNNVYALRFYHYHNFIPNLPGVEFSNLSHLRNCTFETSAEMRDFNVCPVAFIRMDDVLGIRISGTSFTNSGNDTYDWDERGTGIESHNATFYMEGICLDPFYPCENYKLNYFHNLDYGIRAFGQGRENGMIVVVHSDFNLNQNGIFTSNLNNTHILFNTFTIPERNESCQLPRYGLYLEASTGYAIEENNFQGFDYGNYDQNLGMYISNSGPEPNEVYKNDFSDLEYGIVAYGQNRSETGEGLCLVCNNFDLCTNDIHVLPEKDPNGRWLQGRNQGIATNQGNVSSITSLAGNTFSFGDPPVFNYFNHENCNYITYNYHDGNETDYKISPEPHSPEPLVDLKNALGYTFESKESACPSNFGGGGINLSIEKNVVSSENEMVTLYADSIQTVLDGGDTYTLNFDVMTSFPDEAYEIRQQLLDESPYLSDTVIKSAIYKENVLPNAMIRDVLVANPQSAKSSEIIDKVNERNDPMSEEMMDDILEGRNIKGNLEILEDKLASHKTIKSGSLHKLESYYKLDTIDFSGSRDSLISLWSQENDPEILYRLAFLFLNNIDSANCFNILNSIPQLSDLSDGQLLEYEDYVSIIGILWSIKQDANSLDSNRVGQLTELMAGNIRPSFMARNVLVQNSIIDYFEPIYLAEELKSGSVIPAKPEENKSNESNLLVFPNPAKDYIIVSYDLKDGQGNSSILISSMDGNPRFERFLNGFNNQTIISLSGFSEGIYCIQLKNNGETISTVKFLIVK